MRAKDLPQNRTPKKNQHVPFAAPLSVPLKVVFFESRWTWIKLRWVAVKVN
jgi:hypothetical protein